MVKAETKETQQGFLILTSLESLYVCKMEFMLPQIDI